MPEGLSRSKRLAIALAAAAYAAAFTAATMWVLALGRDLGAKGIEMAVILVAVIAAPAAFPFWRSTLALYDRQSVLFGAVMGGFLGYFLAWLTCLVGLDPNLSGPIQSPAARAAMAIAGIAGTIAGAFGVTAEINRPSAPAGSDEALRQAKEWALSRRKGRTRVVVEWFCFTFAGVVVMGTLRAALRGGWTAVRELWIGGDVAGGIGLAFFVAAYMAYNIGVLRWSEMARRHGASDGIPLTTRSA